MNKKRIGFGAVIAKAQSIMVRREEGREMLEEEVAKVG